MRIVVIINILNFQGFEDDYNYVHTFLEPIMTCMFFDNEKDLVFDENGLCIGYKTIEYFLDKEKN